MIIFLFKEVLVCYKGSNLVCELVSDKFVFQDKVAIEMSFCIRVTYRSVGGCAVSENPFYKPEVWHGTPTAGC